MTDPDNVAQRDPARTAALPGSAWRATVAIGPDGTESLWLISPLPREEPGCACRMCAPHDQLTDERQWEQQT